MSKEVEEGKIWAFLAIFLGLIGFLIVLLAKKENKYAMYYAKQSLVMSIVVIAGTIVSSILMIILIGFLLYIAVVILGLVWWVMGMVYAFSGEMKPLPIIGKYAENLKI